MKNTFHPNALFSPKIRSVALVAPAGITAPERIADGVRFLETHQIRVKVMPHADGMRIRQNADTPYLSAPREDRIKDFNQAIQDESIDLILCVRGGFGSAHLLPFLDYETLRQRRLPVVGYSDITAIHAAMIAQKSGIPIAGIMAGKMQEAYEPTALGSNLTWASGKLALDLQLRQPNHYPLPQPLQLLHPNASTVTGKPFAANLTVLASLCGTPFFPDLSGRILILEDVNEPIYKIDRCLTQLVQCGALRNIAGLLYGIFSGCSVEEIHHLALRFLDVSPYYTALGFPFGHELPLGAVNAMQNYQCSSQGVITILPENAAHPA